MKWNKKMHKRARELCEKATGHGLQYLYDEAAFAAESRTLLPAALDRIEKLERALGEARKDLIDDGYDDESLAVRAIDRALAGEDDDV